MACSSTSSTSVYSPPPPPHFSPIKEDEHHDQKHKHKHKHKHNKEGSMPYKHHPTPLHHPSSTSTASTTIKTSSRRRTESDADDGTVSCNKCRPTARDKISVTPSTTSSTNPSPNNLFKSIISSLTKKTPKHLDSSPPPPRDEQWKIALAELSHKLIHVTRKRDEALLEASRLKHSMADLEKKLSKLEIYCHNLKSGLDICNNNSSPHRIVPKDKATGLVESFVNSVSESRSAVRFLSRSMTLQLRQMGTKVHERISRLLLPYDVKISFTKNPRGVLFYLEALLNRALYEDFESVGFQKNGSDSILNPIEKSEASYASYLVLQGLVWEEVLNKGTRHFSEEFSRFCDRKMSEIIAMLGWNRAWPETLLQAFFSAAKSVWLVHLLACSVHPSLPIFRVEKGLKFDGVYMEDMGGDKARKLVPAMVRIMVAPGFYVYSNVVKCKVLCRYSNSSPIT